MYTVYWAPDSGSVAISLLVPVELEVPWEKVLIDKENEEHTRDEFKRMNPHGKIPVLKLPTGEFISETAAIMMYLCDEHPEKGLFPVTGTARAKAMELIIFLSANLYETVLRWFRPYRYTSSSDPSHIASVKSAELSRSLDLIKLLDTIVTGPYALGDQYSAVDIYAYMLVSWHEGVENILQSCPKVKNIYEAVKRRPAIVEVTKCHPAMGSY
ncbi:hypothetical protein HDU93_004335 [Gonapodya sp. JEL0774]|nr:hypothetical protein HDU93_004335 [Gonapodya sp. JEL0774]